MTATVTSSRHGTMPLIAIERPKAAPVVLAAEVGGAGSPSLTALRSIAAAASRLANNAHEIAESLAGPSQRGTLLRQAAGRVLPEIEAQAKVIAESRALLKRRIGAVLSPAADPNVPYARIAQDLAGVAMFNSMDPAARAQLLHSAVYSPGGAGWRRVLLAVDQILLPHVTSAQRRDLAVAAFAAADPEGFKAMTVELEQAAAVSQGLRRTADFVAELTGTREDMTLHAPTAMLLGTEAPLAWGCDARVLDAYLEPTEA